MNKRDEFNELAESMGKPAVSLLAGSPGRVHQVWLIPTPTTLHYKPRVVARPWQPRIEPLATVIFDVPALSLKMRKPSRRNQRRLFDRQFSGPKAAALPGYPKTAGKAEHWASAKGLEVGDARKVRNALRRRRQGR